MLCRSRNYTATALALVLAISLLNTIVPASLFATTDSASLSTYTGSSDSVTTTTIPDNPIPKATAAAAAYTSNSPRLTASAPASLGASLPQISAETTPPRITTYSPSNGAVTGSTITISAAYNDPAPSSGINPGTAMIHVDNVHQSNSVVTDTGISCLKSGLTEGSHKLQAFVCDNEYNCTSATWHITVDLTAPIISSAQPSGTINVTDAAISASFSDGTGIGIDPASVTVTLDGASVNSACGISSTGVNCGVASLTEGVHEVQVGVSDQAGNRSEKNWSFTVDTAAIGISGQIPAEGSWQTSHSPVIQAAFSQAGSGIINTSSINVLLDGLDVTGDTTRQSDGMIYIPAPPLSEGSHTVIITLNDDAGHTGRSEWSFAVDTISPQIESETPTGTATARPTISAKLADSGSGIDPESINLTLDGLNATGSATISGNLITYSPGETLASGPHSVQLAVRDLAGNQQTSAWGFNVPQATATTQPSSGSPASRQLTVVEYWQSYSALSSLGGSWTVSGFQAFPNTYYCPWYDSGQTAGQLKDELVIRNQGAGAATVTVLLGGEIKWQGKVGESGSETIQLAKTTGGPVKIVCPTGQSLEVIHRVTTGGGVISETPAVTEMDLEPVLLLPWYEAQPVAAGKSFLVIANAGTEEAAVEIYVGDPTAPDSLKGHYSIKPNAASRTEIPETSGGPIRIVSTNNQPLLANLQEINQNSFTETMATGLSRLADRHILEPLPGSGNDLPSARLHVGNSNDRDVRVEVKIGDQLIRDPDNPENDFFTISRQSTRAIDLDRMSDQPVEIACTDCRFGEGLVIGKPSF